MTYSYDSGFIILYLPHLEQWLRSLEHIDSNCRQDSSARKFELIKLLGVPLQYNTRSICFTFIQWLFVGLSSSFLFIKCCVNIHRREFPGIHICRIDYLFEDCSQKLQFRALCMLQKAVYSCLMLHSSAQLLVNHEFVSKAFFVNYLLRVSHITSTRVCATGVKVKIKISTGIFVSGKELVYMVDVWLAVTSKT